MDREVRLVPYLFVLRVRALLFWLINWYVSQAAIVTIMYGNFEY